MQTQDIDYRADAVNLRGYLAFDETSAAPRPGVLVFHEGLGFGDFVMARARMLAELGYVAFAADIFGYGEGVLPKNVDEMSAQTTIFRKDRPLTRARTQAGWDALVKHPLVDAGRIALIGYCFGGDVGVEFGSTGAPLALNVSIHGSFEKKYPEGWAKNAKGRFLILHGAEDVGYPMTTVQTVIDDLRVAKAQFHYEVYSGAGHGFSSPKGPDNERANTQSIATATRNMREVFGD